MEKQIKTTLQDIVPEYAVGKKLVKSISKILREKTLKLF